MICLLCNKEIDVEEIDEKLQSTQCEFCGTKYVFSPKQSIIDNKLCGPGGQLAYDYLQRDCSL